MKHQYLDINVTDSRFKIKSSKKTDTEKYKFNNNDKSIIYSE